MIECKLSISWGLRGAIEFEKFKATSAVDLEYQLRRLLERAHGEGADLEGEDEPILELCVRNTNIKQKQCSIAFTVKLSDDSVFAKTDDIFEFEDGWGELGIDTANLPADDDSRKISYIFDKCITWRDFSF